MTREEKIAQLVTDAQNANIIRVLVRNMFPMIADNLSDEDLDSKLALINAYKATLAYRMEDAINFGNKLIIEFTTENVYMGITSDGMTSQVRKALSDVTMCLITGSLYDAIAELKTIPIEKKDPKYITNARLTTFANKIEDYLQIPRTTVS